MNKVSYVIEFTIKDGTLEEESSPFLVETFHGS